MNLNQYELSLEFKRLMGLKLTDFFKDFRTLAELIQKLILIFSTNHFSQ
jgi:hypothetical protein